MLPVPGTGWCTGSDRYGDKLKRAHGKPSFSFVAYGFDTFSEASYALWNISSRWRARRREKFGNDFVSQVGPMLPAGLVKSDAEIFDLVTDTIDKCGYHDRIGLQGDIAADTYFNYEAGVYEGLFDFKKRTPEEMFEFLVNMPKQWPFVIMEDPLSEDDYETAARFTAAVDIQVVGDDLFTTNPARVLEGIKAGAANTVLLKVNQIGTITEAFDMVSLAYQNGYGVMPCSSRGEGVDICDYSVGLKAGTVRETGVGDGGNRFKEIEAELGSRAKFAGKQGLTGARFKLK
jgi:enolase